MTYHLTRLRETGVVQVRVDGAIRHVSLRREEFDRGFPDLLNSVIQTARSDPRLPRIDTQACFVPAGTSAVAG